MIRVEEIVERLRGWSSGPIEQSYGPKDVMLYALGLGIGGDPERDGDLSYVFERDLVTLPTMALTLGSPGFWLMDPALGVPWKQVLVLRQSLSISQSLATSGRVIGERKCIAVHDKGAARGAIVVTRHDLRAKDGTLLSSLESTEYCRGLGGFGGSDAPSRKQVMMPGRSPDVLRLWTVPRQAALIYRLCDDLNPLHADPAVARSVGLPGVILQGLCSFGIAGFLILDGWGIKPTTLHALSADFTAPVLPGDTLQFEGWRNEDGCVFRMRCLARNSIVVDGGEARFSTDQ